MKANRMLKFNKSTIIMNLINPGFLNFSFNKISNLVTNFQNQLLLKKQNFSTILRNLLVFIFKTMSLIKTLLNLTKRSNIRTISHHTLSQYPAETNLRSFRHKNSC